MAINIDIRRFQIPVAPIANMGAEDAPAAPVAGGGENIVKTGHVQNVIDYIVNHPTATDLAKTEALLASLGQTLSLHGTHQIKCEGLLRAAIFEFVKQHPAEAQLVIMRDQFKSPKLSDVLKKINYLSAGIFGYHHSACNYITRFGHHLAQTYFYNRYFVGNYTVMGATFILVGGLQTAFSTDATEDERKKKEAWTTVAFGGIAMLAYPLFHVITSTAKDEP